MAKLVVLGSAADLAKQKPIHPNPQVLHLGLVGKTIQFIRAWDPTLHPRDETGRFISTPDKFRVKISTLKQGDVMIKPYGGVGLVNKVDFIDSEPHKDVPQYEEVRVSINEVDDVTGEILPDVDVMVVPVEYPVLRAGRIDEDEQDEIPRTTVEDLIKSAPDEPYGPEEVWAISIGKRLGREWVPILEEAQGFGLGEDSSLDEWKDFANNKLKDGRTKRTKRLYTVDEIDSLQNATNSQYASWVHELKVGMDKAPSPDPAGAALLAVADWLGREWHEQGIGQNHIIREFMKRARDPGDRTPDELVGTLSFMAPHLVNHMPQARAVANAAFMDAVAKREGLDWKAGPIPDSMRRSAERSAVTQWMNNLANSPWWNGEQHTWIGGEEDFQHLLDHDAMIQGSWLENYLDTAGIEPGEIDEFVTAQMNDLNAAVLQSIRTAQEKWNRAKGETNYDPDTEHTVEISTSKELFEQIRDGGFSEEDLQRLDPSFDERLEGRGSVARQTIVDLAVGKLNMVEGDLGVPTWDQIEFKKQDLAELDELLKDTEHTAIDVPVFFQTGLVQDGVLQIGLNWRQSHYVHGFVDRDLDGPVAEKLERAGADVVTNTEDLSRLFPYEGSGEIYPGTMLELPDDPGLKPLTIKQRRIFITSELQEMLGEHLGGTEPDTPAFREGSRKIQAFNDEWRYMEEEVEWGNASKDEIDQFMVERAIDAQEIAKQFHLQNATEGELKINSWIQTAKLGRLTAARRIEYVLHNQIGDTKPDNDGLTTGAPTSQRGQLRLYGYTPEEAISKLQELGIIGEIEPEVPFKSIMRGDRRYGRILPLHRDYIRGEAHLPEISNAVSHGITGGIQDLFTVLETGSILPISERTRLGVTDKVASSTSQKGDIRSGLDEGVFGTIGFSSWGRDGITVFYKDSAYLRRDVIASPTDYGAGASRYDNYFAHKKKLYEAGEVRKTPDWEEPLAPSARQVHLDLISGADGNEWNLLGGVPVEDWSLIYVQDKNNVREIETKLDILHKRGIISQKPIITHRRDAAEAHGKLETNPITDEILITIHDLFPEILKIEAGHGQVSWHDQFDNIYGLNWDFVLKIWRIQTFGPEGELLTADSTDVQTVLKHAAEGQLLNG